MRPIGLAALLLVTTACATPRQQETVDLPIPPPTPTHPTSKPTSKRSPHQVTPPATEMDKLPCFAPRAVTAGTRCLDRDMARHYYQQGVLAYTTSHFKRAVIMFRRADHFCLSVQTRFNIAKAYQRLKRNHCAATHFRGYLRDYRRSYDRPPPNEGRIRYFIRRWGRR